VVTLLGLIDRPCEGLEGETTLLATLLATESAARLFKWDVLFDAWRRISAMVLRRRYNWIDAREFTELSRLGYISGGEAD